MELSEDDVERIAAKATKTAVLEILTRMGIDVNQPLEMQEDFAWTRKYRKLAENIGSKIILTVVTLMTVGIIAMITKTFWTGGNVK